MILVVAEAIVKDKTQGEFTIAAEKCVAETRKEEGNVSYDLLCDCFNNCKFTFVEEWKSKDALDAHMKTEHFISFVNDIKDLLADELKVSIYDANKVN